MLDTSGIMPFEPHFFSSADVEGSLLHLSIDTFAFPINITEFVPSMPIGHLGLVQAKNHIV